MLARVFRELHTVPAALVCAALDARVAAFALGPRRAAGRRRRLTAWRRLTARQRLHALHAPGRWRSAALINTESCRPLRGPPGRSRGCCRRPGAQPPPGGEPPPAPGGAPGTKRKRRNAGGKRCQDSAVCKRPVQELLKPQGEGSCVCTRPQSSRSRLGLSWMCECLCETHGSMLHLCDTRLFAIFLQRLRTESPLIRSAHQHH